MNCQTIPTCKGGLFGGPAGKLAQRSGDRAASEPPAPAGRGRLPTANPAAAVAVRARSATPTRSGRCSRRNASA